MTDRGMHGFTRPTFDNTVRSDLEGHVVPRPSLTLVEFLTARLDEDAEWAADADRTGNLAADPDRLLREVEAKRAIMERHRHANDANWNGGLACAYDQQVWPCGDLLDLAAVHADHPDYDPSWRP